MGSYQDHLTAEVESWIIPDRFRRAEKFRRERIRHHKLIRDLLLDELGTHDMAILEVGGGPLPVSDLLQFHTRVVVDPLSNQYREAAPCPDHVTMYAEDLDEFWSWDLVLCTNALDHVRDPDLALHRMSEAVKPGGYLALMCAENNALTNPHPAHEHNLSAEWAHRKLDYSFETVWELNFRKHNYRYGWVEFEGKRGQPAFALLMRKAFGYSADAEPVSHLRAI